MSPERLEEIQRLFHAVRDAPADDGGRLLLGVDPELRREVESLLAVQSAGLLLNSPHLDLSAPSPSDLGGATISAGTCLGPYRIDAKLGEGGMGEVYRARDARLGRDVAVKVLPAALARNPDRRARLRREAELLATLNHPHIAAVYSLEETADVTGLVMELVEGPTLAERLTRGAVPLVEALSIARQIAEALEAAHDQGIIHRDLKPANIKVRPDGTVKVLDFGLAKSLQPAVVSSDAADSPRVLSPAMTLAGVIVGTPAYVSPEQARGAAVDKRTDIWAFGCVLYEMLTGCTPFQDETATDTVAAVLSREPDWAALPPGTPVRLQSLIARCLRKNPAQRLHDIADGRFQIEELVSDPHGATITAAPGRRRLAWAPWVMTALLLSTTVFVATRAPRPSSPEAIRFPVFPPEKTEFSARLGTTLNVPSFALSPDGRTLVFSAAAPGTRPTLWLRSLDHVEALQLAGTEDAEDPFWSPDSRWIGFSAEGALKKVPASGGAVQVITELSGDFRGATWGARDTILLAAGSDGIVSVNAAGGTTAPVAAVDSARQEDTYRNPSFLPDGRHFLYSVIGNGDRSGVYVGSLDGSIKKRIVPVLTSAVYAPPGYVLFVNGDTLTAQGFDAERLEVTGRPFFLAEHVGRSTSFLSGVSASLTGAVAYAPPLAQSGRLAWVDRRGTPLETLPLPEGDYTDFQLSPEGTRLATSLGNAKTNAVDIWLTNLSSGRTSRLASGGAVTAAAVWSPDGTRLAFRSNRTGVIELYERSANGGGVDRPLLPPEAYRTVPYGLFPTGWSPNGDLIASAPRRGGGMDLWLLPLGDTAPPRLLIGSAAQELHGNFSPDGRLLAYTSNETGRFEVFVETVPRSDRKWPISSNGGYEPRWEANGREVYYLSETRQLMAVAVGPGPSFGAPVALFQAHVPRGVTENRTHYVPSRDGRRFLVNVASDTPGPPITVLLNWSSLRSK